MALQGAKLPVRENDAGMVFVAGLVSTPVASAAEFDALYACVAAHLSWFFILAIPFLFHFHRLQGFLTTCTLVLRHCLPLTFLLSLEHRPVAAPLVRRASTTSRRARMPFLR